MSDLLTAIFERQLELQKTSYSGDPAELPMKDRIEFIRWNVIAIEDEIHEALGEVSWKPWQTGEYINREAYVGELVDALHFLVNLCLAVGAGPDEIAERYFAKANKNKARMADGYDGVSSKCPLCKRDTNDTGVRCGPIKFTDESYCQQFNIDYRPVKTA
jgi:hypothetical protein